MFDDRFKRFFAAAVFSLAGLGPLQAQHTVARVWNETLLDAIRSDFARPTVHARNLFHVSAAMYDAWAAYDETAQPFLLGRLVGRTACPLPEFIATPTEVEQARHEAISFAAFRILRHRFQNAPLSQVVLNRFDNQLRSLGYDPQFESTDPSHGPSALGNYIASCYIQLGKNDGANEQEDYANRFYEPVNPSMAPAIAGNPRIQDRNRWQPLSLVTFIDQAGNPVPGGGREFLGAEWGEVVPFALSQADLSTYLRDDYAYWVYHDPGPPPQLSLTDSSGLEDPYKWGFSLVSAWSSHLDPTDGVIWDISPASIGNIEGFPAGYEDYPSFYKLGDGGDTSRGWDRNPHTGASYETQFVPRGDYTRVLAEFWADGPDSETPPGHWFTILNYVIDHPEFERRYRGTGPELEPLEWDVKSYFVLGGAMHDAAVAAWGLKGWYDYVRPVSAIRAMADRGQSSDPSRPSYATDGIPLIDGLVELVDETDPLAGDSLEHVGKIKVFAWRGPDFIDDPKHDQAGVDWILAENWWPYQRPTFVTPPFAGFVSGHSTFSRAAAEVLTRLTGDPFFPGGLGEFTAKKNEFLVFEEGPSVDVVLQWATYRDAADQCSLSRIWGGIHPPADDLPGRMLGERVGIDAFHYADGFMAGTPTSSELPGVPAFEFNVYPNPVRSGNRVFINLGEELNTTGPRVYDVTGRKRDLPIGRLAGRWVVDTSGLAAGLYVVMIGAEDVVTNSFLVLP